MPRRDKTGPVSSGGRNGRGYGMKDGTSNLGVGGNCICSKCGANMSHARGIPCASVKCPNCGAMMNREN